MDHVSIVLYALLTLALAIMIAPSVIRLNRGRMLQHIALWLAIVLALAIAYQAFHISDKADGKAGWGAPVSLHGSDKNSGGDDVDDSQTDSGKREDQGYTPPRE